MALINDMINSAMEEGYSTVEIASILGIPEKTVSTRLFRAKAKLKDYLNQQMDITDKFEDDICYLQLQVDGETRYMTVKYQNGYAMSPHGYVQPEEFNTTPAE